MKLVELGVELMSAVTGLHFLFLDPHFGSTVEIVSHARRMIDRYETHKIDRKRLVISVSFNGDMDTRIIAVECSYRYRHLRKA